MRSVRLAAALFGLVALAVASRAEDAVRVKAFSLDGQIEGENISFTLMLSVDALKSDAVLPLVVGDAAYLEGVMPGSVELVREGDRYLARLGGGGGWFSTRRGIDLTFRFASRAVKDGDWRRARFDIPAASVRKVAVVCDRPDLEIQFPGALDVQRAKTPDGKMKVTAYLGIGTAFEVGWKPEVRKLESELVAACDANTIATASIGAMRLDTIFTVRVIQGMLTKLAFDVPDVNVTQVRGMDIQDWSIDRTDPKQPRLMVTLSRPCETTYRLQVEYETGLPRFPTQCSLPVLVPRDMLRASGFLLLGSDSAIKLQIAKSSGLTQVDQVAFPLVALDEKAVRGRPARHVYAYQYAGVPYRLDLTADDIVTSYNADSRIQVTLADNELSLAASVELDIKDAPAREILIETDADPDWTVTSVTGDRVAEADTDVRTENGVRLIDVVFKQAAQGTVLVNLKMEKLLKPDAATFVVPKFKVRGAKSERGYLVLAAEKGIRLKPQDAAGLREVHTGSAPMRVEGAQHAYRFKEPGWGLTLGIERTVAAVHVEAFHLVSLGENVIYGSVTINYDIDGSPENTLRLRIPKEIETVEIVGADIEGWQRDGDVCTVRLQSKVLGDYTLLVTYDKQFAYEGADIAVGGIEAVGADSEVGYMAIASSASLKLQPKALPPSIIAIDREEIPAGYASPVTDPIIGAYKFVRTPHSAQIHVEPYETEQLLGQVSDCVTFATQLSRDGELVTTATYYVKNASRQFLVVRLPAGVRPWSIKRIGENGRREDVLSQTSDGQVLIPVTRPRDPSTPIGVEVVYAQSVGRLGFWSSGLRGVEFMLPMLTETHATFMNWTVSVPERFAIGRGTGDFTAEGAGWRYGFAGVWDLARQMAAVVADGPRGQTFAGVIKNAWSGVHTLQFTRTVSLAAGSGKPYRQRLHVMPRQLGSVHSLGTLLVGLVLGVWLTAGGWLRRRPGRLAGGLVVLAFGLVQTSAGCVVVVLGFVAVPVVLLISGLRRLTRRLFRRRPRLAQVLQSQHAAAPSAPAMPPPEGLPGGVSGALAIWMAVGLLLASLFALTAAAESAPPAQQPVPAVVTPPATNPPAPPPPEKRPVVLDAVTLTVVAPGTGRDIEQSARVKGEFVFEAKEPTSFLLLPAGGVLTSADTGSRHAEVVSRKEGYVVNVRRGGRYTVSLQCQVPVVSREGRWQLALYLPPNMKNKVSLSLPEAGMDVLAPDAVLLKTAQKNTNTLADAVFGPVRTATVEWVPRARKTTLEQTVSYCEVLSLVTLQSGVAEVANEVRYQIAQGELADMKLRVPEGMSVTSVKAEGMATWSFDPASRVLEVILSRPVSGDYRLTVMTQVACEGLPYRVKIGALREQSAQRQRGALALAAPENIQVRVDKTEGLSPMNIEDFPTAALLPGGDAPKQGAPSLRRAYRYQDVEAVLVEVGTESVLPEIRVTESGTVSIADERTVLATKLTLDVAKAGVFSAQLTLPAGFDVESLTGKDVSHWDELKEEGGGVVVHFNRQVTDKTELNLVVARMEKGVEPKIDVPHVTVAEARRHTGMLTVSAERGVRMMVESHHGVDLKKASEAGIQQAGVHVFEILRPSWSVVLHTEVMEPLVKPDVLQWVDLAEGMLLYRGYIQCKIENAGVKTFRIRSPQPGIPLSVTGPNIARVHETDKSNGVWQVDLHGKVENQFAMVATCQIPYDPAAEKVRIMPLQVLDTEGQRGYLVVTCAGRVQVRTAGEIKGLKSEDPRSVPAIFGAGDLSSAIQCYRTVRPDYELSLSVVRHKSADVLPATVNRVRMMSVVSADGKLVTESRLWMSVGSQRYLRVELPNADDTLWTVLVNGREVTTAREGSLHCIPLAGQEGGRETEVDLVYAGSGARGFLVSKQKYQAPKFGLPLNDVEWKFFVVAGLKYYGFGGSMELDRGVPEREALFSVAAYAANSMTMRREYLQKARQVLDAGNQLQMTGRQDEARKAFQEAYNYSQGQADLNEDARVQLRNLVKQQVKVGLVNRRDNNRYQRNKLDLQQMQQMRGFNDDNGNFTTEYAQNVEQRLSPKENTALEQVAEKIIDQQAAAAGVVSSIRITLPEHGRELTFRRPMQIDPAGEVSVVFKTFGEGVARSARDLAVAAAAFLALWAVVRRVYAPQA